MLFSLVGESAWGLNFNAIIYERFQFNPGILIPHSGVDTLAWQNLKLIKIWKMLQIY